MNKYKEQSKMELYQKLLDANAFYSYDMSKQKLISDRSIIAETIVHLDINEIILLFKIYPKVRVKKVWREELVTQGDYYYSLNRLMAWMFFDIKNPDKYIKTVITNQLKKNLQR